ncbi:MltR family transcriptional regulator [Ferrovibrio sp.]|uniref:MltR family transcriptional regulator n=1 Tax=Ferrovibrio sp. TaxID=1917215 RepID=UPI00311F82E5
MSRPTELINSVFADKYSVFADKPGTEEFTRYLSRFNDESDRGAVMIAASMMDDLLRRKIIADLEPVRQAKLLFDGLSAPLGSLSAKMLMAYTLGLIDERMFKELRTIQKIRNRFAHDIHVDFKDDSIKDLCGNLTFMNDPEKKLPARNRFDLSSVTTILLLSTKPAEPGAGLKIPTNEGKV